MTDEPASESEDSIPIEVERRDDRSGRERLEEGFDEGIVDLLSWILDTETRARIYVYLRQHPRSTSEEIASGTGLYPSTVREALAELHEEGTVDRVKRSNDGAGNNPYEYTAIAPSELVNEVISQVQDELNTVFNLDRYLGGDDLSTGEEPISITVESGEYPVDSTIDSSDTVNDTVEPDDDTVGGVESSGGAAGSVDNTDDGTADERDGDSTEGRHG